MRKFKAIKIDDREFTIRELTVKDVWSLKDNKVGTGDLEQLVAASCPELTMETALSMAPSELKTLWEAFKEVNADFLGVMAFLGLDKTIVGIMKAEVFKAMASLSEPSAVLSDPAMAGLPGTTAGASS